MKRSFKHGSAMAIYVTLVVMILIVVNSVSFSYYRLFDLTKEGVYTLSDQSRKIAVSLKEKINIYAFVKPDRNQEVADFFDQYAYESKNISYEIIDPDKNPAKTRKYGVNDYGTFLFETASGRREIAKQLNEQDVTNAIIKATTAKQKKIYITLGHNERSVTDDKSPGWSGAKKALESSMYAVETLNLFHTGAIPQDADLIIVPGPRDDFQKGEVKILSERMDEGGRFLFALDPSDLPNLIELLGKFGFKFYDDMVLDPLSQKIGFDPLVATISTYDNHPIVKNFRSATFFPVARSLELKSSNSKNAELKPIGRTAPLSWSETDLKSIEKGVPVYSESDDIPGPRIVAASAQWTVGNPEEKRKIGAKPQMARMVVTGDSDFASNSTIGLSGNIDLFLNMVAWLLEEDTRISIRPKSKGFHPIFFTSAELKAVFWSMVVVLPALVVMTGIVVALRRRKS